MKNLEILKNRKIQILLGVIVFAFFLFICTLTGLFFLRPDITTDSLEVDSIEISEEYLNLVDPFPQFDFSRSHQIIINDDKYDYYEDFSFEREMFEEGDNSIKIRAIQNYYLFDLVSESIFEKEIIADFIPPEFSYEDQIADDLFLLLENLDFEIEYEDGAEIFIGDQKLEPVSEEDRGDYSYEVSEDGEVVITIKDIAGNISEVDKSNITLFNKSGYERNNCNKVGFPLSDNLRFGVSGFRNESQARNLIPVLEPGKTYESKVAEFNQDANTCTESDLKLKVYEKSNAVIPCYACGASLPPSFSIAQQSGSIAEVIETIKAGNLEDFERVGQTYTVEKEETIVSQSGLDVVYLQTKNQGYDEYFGNFESYVDSYTWEIDSVVYVMIGYVNKDSNSTMANYMREIAQNIKPIN